MSGATSFKEFCQGLQALFTIIGIMAAGGWTYLLFIRTRQKYPRAKLEHKVSFWPLSDDRTLMRASLYVRNESQVLISLSYGLARVQLLVPMTPELEAKVTSNCEPILDGETEIAWPVVCEREIRFPDGTREIEPSESEEFHYDFVLPSGAEVVSLYTYVENSHKRRRWILSWNDPPKLEHREIGWNLTSTHAIEKQVKPIVLP